MSYDVVHEPGFELHASQEDFIVTVSSVMLSLATVGVILRFISRRVTRVALLWDDWLILVALFFTIATASINIYGARHDHFGTHLLATATNSSLRSFLLGLYVFQVTYTLAIGTAKLSIVALYWRIFPSHNLKWPLLITGAITIAWIISTSLVALLSCTPPSAFYDFLHPGHCINSPAYFISTASINIATDILLLILPLHLVHRLHLPRAQRLGVSAIFLLGIFGTVCAILRLHVQVRVYAVGIKRDPTWDLVGGGLWSAVEACVVVVCACLPSLRPLLRGVVRGSLGSLRRSTGRSGRNGRNGGSGERSRWSGRWYGAGRWYGSRGAGYRAYGHGGSGYGGSWNASSRDRRSGRFSVGLGHWARAKPWGGVRVEEREMAPSRTDTTRSVETGLMPAAQVLGRSDGLGAMSGGRRIEHRGGEVWVTSDVRIERSASRAGLGRGRTASETRAWAQGGGSSEAGRRAYGRSGSHAGKGRGGEGESWMDLQGERSSGEELGDVERGRGVGLEGGRMF